jgi:hypothetical protein
MKFEKSFTTLNEILNCQRLTFEKTGLGYSEKKEDANEYTSKTSKQVKKGPRVMMIYSNIVSRLKTTGRKNNMFHRRQILFTRKELRRLSHQDGITQSSTKIVSLDIFILVMVLVIKQ